MVRIVLPRIVIAWIAGGCIRRNPFLEDFDFELQVFHLFLLLPFGVGLDKVGLL